MDDFLSLDIRAIARFFVAQGAAFWLLNLYMFFEYIRPQSRWPALDVLPWPQVTLLGCLAMLLLEGRRLRFGILPDWLLAIFSAVIVASALGAYNPSASWDAMALWWNWLILYFLITQIVTTERRFFVFTLGWMLWNINMAQFAARSWVFNGFRFRSWGVTGSPGWFRNSGEFGIEMTLFLPICIYFLIAVRDHARGWQRVVARSVPLMVVLGVIGSSSRGALLGTAAIGAWTVLKSRRRAVAGISFATVALLVVLAIPTESKTRFSEMGKDPDSVRRLTYWADGIEMMNAHPILGVGFFNWLDYWSAQYLPQHTAENPLVFRNPQLPHNPFIQAGAELGYTGLAVYCWLILATFLINARTRRLCQSFPGRSGKHMTLMAHGLDGALVGYLTSGFFVTVLYYPFFWVNLAMSVALFRSAQATSAGAGGRGRSPRYTGGSFTRHPLDLDGARRVGEVGSRSAGRNAGAKAN